jgi:hypothetical protein
MYAFRTLARYLQNCRGRPAIQPRLLNSARLIPLAIYTQLTTRRYTVQSMEPISLVSTRFAPPMAKPVNMELTLTKEEEELCKLLNDATLWLRERQRETHTEGAEPVELRIAGGWVRDKVSISIEKREIDLPV